MSNTEKTAGVLDTPSDELAPDVWEKDRTLRPEIKAQIYDTLQGVLPDDQIKHVFILGSLTGYKYSDTSDLDVNVAISPYDDAIGKTYLTRKINGATIPTSDREINYFITEWRDDTIENFKQVPWGVYSVTNDEWITSPGNPEELRDPKDQFWYSLQLANSIFRKFDRYVKNWKKDIQEYERMKREGANDAALESQKKEIKMGRERLKDIIRQADKERKMAYHWGWGTPRSSEENIIFKTLEDSGKHDKLFKKLRDEVDKENIENASKRKSKRQKSK